MITHYTYNHKQLETLKQHWKNQGKLETLEELEKWLENDTFKYLLKNWIKRMRG